MDKQRLDSWLWASRFYKARKLAYDAVTAGHVKVNGQRCKPGRFIKIGDAVMVKKNEFIFDLTINGLSKSRLSARLAAALYDESETSKTNREQAQLLRKSRRVGLVYNKQLPDKKQRKKLIRLKQNPFD